MEIALPLVQAINPTMLKPNPPESSENRDPKHPKPLLSSNDVVMSELTMHGQLKLSFRDKVISGKLEERSVSLDLKPIIDLTEEDVVRSI